MQEELYSSYRRPLLSLLPSTFHWVPQALRSKAGDLLLVGRRRGVPFPRFPMERSLEALRYALSRCGAGALDSPPRPGSTSSWPGGNRFCVCLTHDVDSSRGIRGIREILEIESACGLRSCWFLVGRLFAEHPDEVEFLEERGQEIGIHGHRHTLGLASAGEAAIRRVLEKLDPIVRSHRILGFRAPHYQRSRQLLELLPSTFRYDSSIPDADSFTLGRRGGGSCRIFPYPHGSLWELPATVPYEIPLHLGTQASELLSFWWDKIEWIREAGGMVLVNTHPEPAYLGNREVRRAYVALLERLAWSPGAWHALPREILREMESPTNGEPPG